MVYKMLGWVLDAGRGCVILGSYFSDDPSPL